jgi:hypothetical protein
MIEKQYFAHRSPSGIEIADLAASYGYSFLNIGENLALGNFSTSKEVVEGWMNSPGHRANILNDRFSEIGVAALLGEWEGREVWFAVQEFGRPESACPTPDALSRKKIEIYETQIDSLAITLANLKSEIDSGVLSGNEEAARVKDYNTIVDLYNDIIRSTDAEMERYNAMVRSFNVCVGSEGSLP